MTPQRIDVHQHVVPPFWAEGLDTHGGDPSGWHSPDWSPGAAIEFMDSLGIAAGVLSLTAPGVSGWLDADRPQMARRVNEYTADLVRHHPDRFGNFVTLPLLDIDAALHEVEYGFDTLHAEGVILLSNYEGKYLGDQVFHPLWEELDRRSAVVFVHPGKPEITVIDGLPGPMIDYPFDTTRTAVHMAVRGVLDRYPRTRIILSHGGGFLPYASHRFAELFSSINPGATSSASLLNTFQRFYFDTALTSSPAALPTLTAFAPPDRILYGSDFPYAAADVGASFTTKLDDYSLTEGMRSAINHRNARGLFPRLAPAALRPQAANEMF